MGGSFGPRGLGASPSLPSFWTSITTSLSPDLIKGGMLRSSVVQFQKATNGNGLKNEKLRSFKPFKKGIIELRSQIKNESHVVKCVFGVSWSSMIDILHFSLLILNCLCGGAEPAQK